MGGSDIPPTRALIGVIRAQPPIRLSVAAVHRGRAGGSRQFRIHCGRTDVYLNELGRTGTSAVAPFAFADRTNSNSWRNPAREFLSDPGASSGDFE